MTTAQKRIKLRAWFTAAQSAGVAYCQFLQDKAAASLEGAETGAGRMIQSASQGGESASYGDPADDPVPQDEAAEFLALSAEFCLACPGTTDQEKLDCLIANVAVSARYVVKSHTGLRTGCGC